MLRVRLRCSRGFVLTGLLLMVPTESWSNDYWAIHAREVSRCEEIDPGDYESGLIMNPDGYRAYYRRSACLQDVAIKMRDIELCDQVRRRWSLFGSSWGYSKKNCRKLVGDALSGDRAHLAELKRGYRSGPVRLTGFEVEKNGNGRDYDIIPEFSPGMVHGYHVSFWILQGDGRYLLSESGFHLDGRNNIRMFEYRNDIQQRFSQFRPGSTHRVEGRLTLSIGTGNMGGRWSPAFIDAEFPESQRTQALVRQVKFE